MLNLLIYYWNSSVFSGHSMNFNRTIVMAVELKIMLTCHRSFSDPFWYMTDQIQFGRTYFYCTFPMGKSLIICNTVPILND